MVLVSTTFMLTFSNTLDNLALDNIIVLMWHRLILFKHNGFFFSLYTLAETVGYVVIMITMGCLDKTILVDMD